MSHSCFTGWDLFIIILTMLICTNNIVGAVKTATAHLALYIKKDK